MRWNGLFLKTLRTFGLNPFRYQYEIDWRILYTVQTIHVQLYATRKQPRLPTSSFSLIPTTCSSTSAENYREEPTL